MTKEEFAAMYQEQQESGLTMKEYCMLQGVSFSSYRYWRKKFGIGCNPTPSAALPASSLAPVQIKSPRSSTASGIMIEMPNGVRIGFGSGYEREAMDVINRICHHV